LLGQLPGKLCHLVGDITPTVSPLLTPVVSRNLLF
jgi:hypothetical protein